VLIVLISLHSSVTTDSVSHLSNTRASRQNMPSITAMKQVRFSTVYSASLHSYKQEGAAVEGPPAMGPSLQLSMCVLFWECRGNEVTRCKAARDPYATCQISS